jgi:hypothetical protein
MEVLKFPLGRWKSEGGESCVCVADAGRAQSGRAGFCVDDTAGTCVLSGFGAAEMKRTGMKWRSSAAGEAS